MSSEVKTVELGEIVDITSSKRIFRKEYVESGIPFYRGKEIIEKSSGNEPSTDIYITKERYNEIKRERGVPQHKDILLTSVGTLGVPYQVQKDEIFYFKDGNLTWIKDFSDEVLPEFIYVWLKSPKAKEEINRITIGSTQQALTITSLKTLELDLPALDQQKKICDIYYGFTDKIRLNQQTNETLEAMAQVIFKSWFVDFDPVRAKIEAKADGRDPNRAAMAMIAGISLEMDWDEIEAALDQKLDRMSEAQQQQLTHTAELFPDELVESEIGEVPKGWGISEIGKEVNSVGGTTPRTKNPEYWDGGKIAWTTPKDLSNANSKVLLETNRKITDEGLDQISSGLLPIDTVLMSSRAPVGYLALSKIPVAINQGYIAMICDQVLTAEYVLHWTESNMDMIKQHAGGSTFSEISKRNFRPLPVLVPSEEILSVYSDKVGSFYDSITAKMKENNTLENLRDTLLPKLISGELNANSDGK